MVHVVRSTIHDNKLYILNIHPLHKAQRLGHIPGEKRLLTIPKAMVDTRHRRAPLWNSMWMCAFVAGVRDAWYMLTQCLLWVDLESISYTLHAAFLVRVYTIILGALVLSKPTMPAKSFYT